MGIGEIQELYSDRLKLCKLESFEAPFILKLLNDADFIKHIGDKDIKTLERASQYILKENFESYQRLGFGMFSVRLLNGGPSSVSIGLCGLVKRSYLDNPDLGYAFLPEFRGQGYAREAAKAVIDFARRDLKLKKLHAIVSPENASSLALLEKIGFVLEGKVLPPGEKESVVLFQLLL